MRQTQRVSIRLTRPSSAELISLAQAATSDSLAYDTVGISAMNDPPSGYRLDRWSRSLGKHEHAFGGLDKPCSGAVAERQELCLGRVRWFRFAGKRPITQVGAAGRTAKGAAFRRSRQTRFLPRTALVGAGPPSRLGRWRLLGWVIEKDENLSLGSGVRSRCGHS